MTKQELHICDVCGEEFKVPEEQLRSLSVKTDGEVTFEHEICFACYQSLEKWILKRREPTE